MLIFEKPREIAFHALQRRERSREFIEEVVEKELAQTLLKPVDRRLLQELCYGTVRWQRTLDWLISRKTGGRKQDRKIQILLRLGLYQLFWLDRIPDHAVAHETVSMAKQLGFQQRSGFVNAILRAYLRERDDTIRLLTDLKSTNPPIGHSHPDWLFESWSHRYGIEKSIRLLEWNNTPAGVFARVNRLRTCSDDLEAQWKNEGVISRRFIAPWLKKAEMFALKSKKHLIELASFCDGLYYIQDPSTLLAVEMLDPQPGHNMLDLCAAPGGKTTFAAQLMENRGSIVARDSNQNRLNLLRENCERLGVNCVEPRLSHSGSGSESDYDRVLVDAPCSNTGVMQRRIDLRWRLTSQELHRLRKIQIALLRSAASQVKPEGLLVYSTCSLEPEENQQIVQEFLDLTEGFLCDMEKTLEPTDEGVDGCYAARMRRSKT